MIASPLGKRSTIIGMNTGMMRCPPTAPNFGESPKPYRAQSVTNAKATSPAMRLATNQSDRRTWSTRVRPGPRLGSLRSSSTSATGKRMIPVCFDATARPIAEPAAANDHRDGRIWSQCKAARASTPKRPKQASVVAIDAAARMVGESATRPPPKAPTAQPRRLANQA